jgi:glycosyltransferase involved in cell wall biosynthesis
MNNPRLSIITVVYNSEHLIERTIKSVLDQTYNNVEYIIIDGASKDNTLSIIKKYESNISKLVSEPDKGLYDAMNKGLALATGDYVCFLNSGDELYSITILEKIVNSANNLIPDVIYGETIIVDENQQEIGMRRLKAPDKLNKKSFKYGMLVCHQSVYVKRNIADAYNLKYKIAADFEWVLSVIEKAKLIHNTGLVHTRFLDGGLNKKNIRKGLTERFKIMVAHYGLFSTILHHFVISVKFFWFLFRNKRF